MRRVAQFATARVATSARPRATLLLFALLTAAVMLLNGAPTPASSAPGDPTDPEGGTPSLRQSLADASKGYADARGRLLSSQRRQAELVRRRNDTEARVAVLTREVNALARAAYRDGRPSTFTAVLDSKSVPTFLGKSEIINRLSSENDAKITALRQARDVLLREQQQLEAEIRLQAAQERAMAKRKSDAEKALSTVGGGVSGGLSTSRAGSAVADSVQRNPDGSFTDESCSADDPTTSGCLTPRTVHALQQARAAGFTRFTRCFREASFGEHPKGRACDFSAAPDTFGGVATGGERQYGEDLAGYFVDNSDRLGVLYVIWFKQIWLPGTGWRAYDGGNGDPASDHTNHVHLSVQ